MPLLGRLRGLAIEKQLEDFYTTMYARLMGVSIGEAAKAVRDAIGACKRKGKEEGTSGFGDGFGDQLLLMARKGVTPAVRIVAKARNEGARDEDISEWWNLHDLQRRMVVWSETVFRYATFRHHTDEGLDGSQAMAEVRRMFPMYGDPEDTTHVLGEDRLLPNELRGRVDAYREKVGAEAIRTRSSGYSTYNAFVRAEIREGRL